MKIILYPDPVLRKKAELISDFGQKWVDIANDMAKTLRETGGLGLAGPQVDISSQIIIVKHGYEEYTVLCNPKIGVMSNSKLLSYVEGCLSLPGINLKITRPDKIVVNYQDCFGAKQTFYADGLTSRIIQHEVDHLLGKTILDRASKKNLLSIKSQIDKLEEDYNILMNSPAEVLPT